MKNFKLAVPECLRAEILQRLFDCGYVGDIKTDEKYNLVYFEDNEIDEKYNFVYFEDNEIIAGFKFNTFLIDPLPEITLTEFYQLTEKTESENKIDKIRDLVKQLQELTDDK